MTSSDSEAALQGRIYIVRHGETQENRDGILQGQLDTVLNAMGKEQARLVGEALKGVVFGSAFSSDLSRAVKTAEAILGHHPGVELVKEEALRERYMGALEGRSSKELGALAANGAETTKDFRERGMAWWKRRILGCEMGDRNVLVTSHGGLLTSLVRGLVESGLVECAPGVRVGKCANASVTIIAVDAGGLGTLVTYSDTTHLTSAAPVDYDTNADEIDST